MNLLLDTHIFLWYISADPQLPDSARVAIGNSTNQVFLSPVSVWEAIIKHNLGKLPLPHPPHIYLPQQHKRHKISKLAVSEEAVVHIAKIPDIHRDPFDRLLIAQALQHNLTPVTVDQKILAYPISSLPL